MVSSETSQITVDPAEMVDGGTSSFLDYVASQTRSTKWTNEKHCMYLKSMEASFVNELHCSMGLYRVQEQKKKVFEKDLFQQHKRFRDGVWKNVCVNEYGGKSEATLEASAIMTNPGIKHFRHTAKHQSVEGSVNVASDNNSRSSMTTLSRQDSVDSNIEMSDQNFVDSNESMKSCRERRAKRSRKTEANNTADNDQVVPKDMTAPHQTVKGWT